MSDDTLPDRLGDADRYTSILEQRCKQLEAELARLNGRKCETCKHSIKRRYECTYCEHSYVSMWEAK